MKILAIVMLLGLASCGFQYSDGNRVGSLYKFSKKGFVCKTYEGILKTGFMTTNSNGVMTSEEFTFSVEEEDSDVVMLIQEAMQQNKKVELEYAQKLFNPPCSPSSSYRIKKVKFIN